MGKFGPKGGLRKNYREPPVAAPGRRGAILGLCPGFVHPATSPQGQACSTVETAFYNSPPMGEPKDMGRETPIIQDPGWSGQDQRPPLPSKGNVSQTIIRQTAGSATIRGLRAINQQSMGARKTLTLRAFQLLSHQARPILWCSRPPNPRDASF